MKGLDWITLAKYVAVLAAAIIIGNWFLIEVKKAKFNRKPWYKPYISVPGIIILLAVLVLPLFLLLFEK